MPEQPLPHGVELGPLFDPLLEGAGHGMALSFFLSSLSCQVIGVHHVQVRIEGDEHEVSLQVVDHYSLQVVSLLLRCRGQEALSVNDDAFPQVLEF